MEASALPASKPYMSDNISYGNLYFSDPASIYWLDSYLVRKNGAERPISAPSRSISKWASRTSGTQSGSELRYSLFACAGMPSGSSSTSAYKRRSGNLLAVPRALHQTRQQLVMDANPSPVQPPHDERRQLPREGAAPFRSTGPTSLLPETVPAYTLVPPTN